MTANQPGGDEPLSVGQVARQFGISVRTLHHYDEVGLLTPGERSHAGYRHYGRADLDRLAQIVVYRRLGFSLTEVAGLLVDGAEVAVHLRRQRDLVAHRLKDLERLAAALDAALAGHRAHQEDDMADQPLTDAELKELFGDDFDESHQAEAEQRWGETDAWRQSQQRTSRYTKADWQQVKAEAEKVLHRFAAAKRAGLAPDSTEAMDAADAHRQHLHRFYDCSTTMHRGLADMYLADPRFTAYYEKAEPGLAQWVHDAIHADADRQDG
jgi:MerR family transcriptional regulator, thiopeptide resistance regulator